jgi:hypothetical protein
MLCKLDALVGSPGLCVNKLDFILQSRQVGGQFTTAITTAALIGLISAFPYAFFEIWRFIRPGLYPAERKAARGATFFVTVLFMMGILFGYYIISPLTINFLANFKIDPSIANEFDILSYFSTLATLTLSCGLMFQLPIVAFFLSKAGRDSSRPHAGVPQTRLHRHSGAGRHHNALPRHHQPDPGGVAAVRALRSKHRRVGQRWSGARLKELSGDIQ